MGDVLKKVEIYTDGACTGNPGKGGYGAVLIYNGNEKRISKGFRKTTNNRMELMAAIEALKLLKENCIVDLYSDSKYLTDAINQKWLSSWQKNGWKKADKKPVLNRDLWEELLLLINKHEVTFIWVKGHNGNPYNEICDTMAVEAYNNSSDNIDETYENL
ncbi:MAG: ribonuclease HI [Clostridia bacterium]|nr:ribonuclease HI [Clostridia bacterium]